VLVLVWRERWFVAKAFVIGALVAAVISLLIPPKYQSAARIMPPEKQGLGGLAGLLAAAGEGGGPASLIGGIVSDTAGIKSTGAVYSGMLKSDSIQDAVVNRFDLRRVYRRKYQKDARETLGDMTEINEDRKSGIITITVTDRSPQRAADISNGYVDTLNSLLAQLNTSSAHRERVFIENRLKTVKEDLEADEKELSEYSSKNLTLDVKEQGKAMVLSAATLEGELIAAESQLSGLEQIYTSNNVRVRALQARIAELKAKISELRGTPGDSNPNPTSGNDFDMSIAKLPTVGVKFLDLYRQVKIQETVFEVLTKQYELAKVEEAKELPTVKVLDQARVPELKSSPKRTLMTIVGALTASMLAVCYLAVSFQFRRLGASHPLGLLGLELRGGLAEDIVLLKRHTPKPVLRTISRVLSRMSRRMSSPES
jgi:uncharacterized protein involved in exopolysaccharide biosynthesis